MREKRFDLLMDEFVIALAIIVVIATALWYMNGLVVGKGTADEMVDSIQQSCAEIGPLGLDCELAQESYNLNFEVICGKDMETTLNELNEEIQGSKNYWFVTRQVELEPIKAFDLPFEVGDKSLGEIYIGINYFVDIHEYKITSMFQHGILAKPCSVDTERLARYAECDFENARSLLPGVSGSLSSKFIDNAGVYLQAGDYIGAITYSGAAVAFQDQIARNTYSELTKTGAPMPVCGQ